MAGSTISFSYVGIGDNILRADFMIYEMRQRAQRVYDEAVATAPVYEGDEEDTTAAGTRSRSHVSTTKYGGSRGNRAAGIVSNSAPEARWVEFGLGPSRLHPEGQRAHATLRNALRAAGD